MKNIHRILGNRIVNLCGAGTRRLYRGATLEFGLEAWEGFYYEVNREKEGHSKYKEWHKQGYRGTENCVMFKGKN